MNLIWKSKNEIPDLFKQLDPKDFIFLKESKINSMEVNNKASNSIFIISENESLNFEESFFLWVDGSQAFPFDLYDSLSQKPKFLGVMSDKLSLEELQYLLQISQTRQLKKMKQIEIIQKVKSQNVFIEENYKNLSFQYDLKTKELMSNQRELEKNVKFERESIIILKKMLETTSFKSFYTALKDSFKAYDITNIILFYKNNENEYKTHNLRLQNQDILLDKEKIKKMSKSEWADLVGRPIIDFKSLQVGNKDKYVLGFEFTRFEISKFNDLRDKITYLGNVFDMIFDFLFDKEKIVKESLQWSKSFDSMEDPILIVDEFFEIIRSNQNINWQNKKCYKMLFGRLKPCDLCPIQAFHSKKSNQNQSFKFVDSSKINLEGDYQLNTFPFQFDTEINKKLWVHHYESKETENKLKAQFIKTEKFSYLGNLVDNVIHKISNPLTGMKASVEILVSETYKNQEIKEDLLEIQNGIYRSFQIIKNLKDFSESKIEMTEIDASELIETTLILMKSVTRDVKIEWPKDKIKLNCPVGLVKQVIFNLVNNSCQAMDYKGDIEFKIQKNKNFVNLIISDTGPGIPLESKTKIFNPFFSTKEKGHGTGIGLFLSRQIMTQFGGDLTLIQGLKKGASFCISFPL